MPLAGQKGTAGWPVSPGSPIERAVARDAADRYPSAGALIAAAREREGSAGTVTKVDPSIQSVVGDPIEVGGRPGGIDAEP